MESDGKEAFHQNPKRSKLPSTSMQDSSFNLPAELIIEILLRLPVKSLLQFRCVSKSWLALISSPQFIKTHLSLSANNKDQTHHRFMMGFNFGDFKLKDCSYRSLFYNSVTEAYDLKYPMYHLIEESFWSVGSVNGLICLVNGTKDLFLWNPSIRKYKKLPDPRLPRKKKLPGSRRKSRYHDHIYGFGYDELHDDYKVVGIFVICGSSPHVDVKIYSLKSDSWRKVHYFQDGVHFSRSNVLVNGKLHWTTTTGPDDMHSKITSFDLADENWGNVDQTYYGEGMSSLRVLGSDLSMFVHDLAVGVDVWVMKEYGLKESWTKLISIKYPVDDLPNLLFLPSLFLSNIGEILVGYGSIFIIYNAKDESFRFVEVINSDTWRKAEIYIESLVSPFSTEGI